MRAFPAFPVGPALLATLLIVAMPGIAAVINGVTVHVETDTDAWTSQPQQFDTSSAAFSTPTSSALQLVVTSPYYVRADVPVACTGIGLGLVQISLGPPNVVTGSISCGAVAAREYVNTPTLTSRPCVDPTCTGQAAVTARYAAAYDELSVGNTQVKFEWRVYATAHPDRYYFGPWTSNWQNLPATGVIPQTPAPNEFIVNCADGTITALVNITTSPDMRSFPASLEFTPTCLS